MLFSMAMIGEYRSIYLLASSSKMPHKEETEDHNFNLLAKREKCAGFLTNVFNKFIISIIPSSK